MHRALHRCAPLAVATAIFLLGTAAWRLWVEPRMPEPLWGVQTSFPEFVTLSGATTTLFQFGAPHPRGVLFAGDSRPGLSFIPEVLAREGVAHPMVLMGPAAQLRDVLGVARGLPQRRLVLGLSPLSVSAPVIPECGVILARELARTSTDRIDERFGHQLRAAHRALVRPLEPRHWFEGWFQRNSADDDQPYYRRLLGPETREQRAERLRALEAELRALRAAGWEIVCVRLPIAPTMRAVENEAFERTEFDALCRRVGLPYFDDIEAEYPTSDSSHLTPAAARAYSASFAARLDELGWR